ncbi:DMT family transporter [Pleomorphochaeta sp. DL1XJH-081]|uniref:DMT family transporter n=1 Tax=Pleomorphochaeta sp. DL1XJH-081 TaxID=3409690 RepID=UPI003BB80DDC
MHLSILGSIQVLLAGICWGTYGTIASHLPAGIPSLAVGTIRLGVGALGLALVLAIRHKGHVITRGNHFNLGTIALGAIALAVAQTTLYIGIRNAGVTIATMIFIGTPPLFSGLYSLVVRKERQSMSWLTSSLVIAFGCYLMAISEGVTAQSSPLVWGSIFATVAGASWTMVGTMLRDMEKVASPVESSFVIMAAASLVMLPIALLQGAATWIDNSRVIFLSLALGLLSAAIPYWLFTTGARRIPASHAFLYGLSEPITASFLGMVVLGERLTPLGMIGYLAVVTSLIFFSVWEMKGAKTLGQGEPKDTVA